MSATLSLPAPQAPRQGMGRLARWILLSLALHALLIAWAPRLRMHFDEQPTPPAVTVFLRSLPQPPAEPETTPIPPQVQEAAPPPPAAQKAPRENRARVAPPKPRERAVPPVIAQPKPVPETPAAPAAPSAPAAPPIAEAPPPAPRAPPSAAQSAPLPAETDLAAYVEARRRARGEGADPAAAEAERANRGVLANAVLKPNAPINFPAKKPTANSGWFRIDRRGHDYAEFTFFGWNENFRQHGLQLVEVRKGDASNIDVAVIRSVIDIIRRYESGDFNWYSKRLGKTLVLSARPRDQAGLEQILLQEFADDLRRYR